MAMRKCGDWEIYENPSTGEKTFTLPKSKTKPFTNWRWVQSSDQGQNHQQGPDQLNRKSYLEDMNVKSRTPDN